MDAPSRQILLSLPPAMARAFHKVEDRPFPEWFASCDPAGSKLGSGGGVVQLLFEDWQALGSPGHFDRWVARSPKLALLAGGQSRRLPAYAPAGKIFIPMPALRWSLGQRIDDTLLDFMLPDFNRMLDGAGAEYPLMVGSGDVVLRFPEKLPKLPKVDVLGLGMWVSPETASHFGVFFAPRTAPNELAFFKQKPSPETVRALSGDYLCMVDTGVWLLGEKAIRALLMSCGWQPERNAFKNGIPDSFELYSEFGPALGTNPGNPRPGISELSAAVVPLSGAEFYHLGTSRQMIESISALQNCQLDQMRMGPIDTKPHPDIYVLNADFEFSTRSAANYQLWIENATLASGQRVENRHIITGVPDGLPDLELRAGICLDIAPIGEAGYCVRAYGFDDPFKGPIGDVATVWLAAPAAEWFAKHGIALADAGIDPETDIQLAPIFPVVDADGLTADFIAWLQSDHPADRAEFRERFLARRLSAMEISEQCNIERLYGQRRNLLARALPRMRSHSRSNPFYRLDLASVAKYYPEIPQPTRENQPLDPIRAVHAEILQSAIERRMGSGSGAEAEGRAFHILKDAIVERVRRHLRPPRRATLDDQIVWGRSPIRLDLAGGWSDTPPYCFKMGGGVVNVAANVNGQPPVQVFFRVAEEPAIVLRSIDIGIETRIETYEDLADYARPGSGFALARAALCLAGFHPEFQTGARHTSLREQLREFGGGIEISLLAAAPKGSGLGTSSILAATLLGVASNACGLSWDHSALVTLTLAIEQMLTTGGGWQDQAGGIYRGIKYVETDPGLDQAVSLRWVPDHLFSNTSALGSVRLYYTGITRMAVDILREIVRGMFLNSRAHLEILGDIRRNADATFEALLRDDWTEIGACVRRSWGLNCRLDSGTNPPAVQAIFDRVQDYTAGAKLLGAGGGGYLLFLGKDEESAARLQRELENHPPNASARFVDFSVSDIGLQITRS